MSENSDILEFIAQCLLSHRADNTSTKNNIRASNYIIDATKTNLLKRNIQDAIHDRIFQESLEESYKLFEVENSSNTVTF